MDTLWLNVAEIAGSIGIPSAAILVSTLLAIRLAKSERESAAEARAVERAQIAADRQEDRTNDAFVRTLTALATLNTVNLRAESIVEPLRDLRVGLTLLVAANVEGEGVLGHWFENERMAATSRVRISMQRLETIPFGFIDEQDAVDGTVWGCAPVNSWASEFATNLRLWRRGEFSSEKLASLSGEAATLAQASE